MQRTVVVGVAVLLVAAVVPGTVGGAASQDNEPPLVDAGLDQRVQEGARVRLDGSGTRDPDGRIVRYRWTIRTPNGTTVTPACTTCVRTWFRATEPGVYAVTLSATDDDGATRTDTLYVTVVGGAREPPSVRLSVPDSPAVNRSVTLTANLSRGSAPLSRVIWRIGGEPLVVDPVAATETTATLEHAFGQPGAVEVSVTLVDAANRTATASKQVVVTSPGAGGPSGGGGSGLRAIIKGPSKVERGEGQTYMVVLQNTQSAEGYDSFRFNWSNVNGSAELPHRVAYREFYRPPGSTVQIAVHAIEKVGTNKAYASLSVDIINDTGGIDWNVSSEAPDPEIHGPDVVTACEPTVVTFRATDTNSGVAPETDFATSYVYKWKYVDSATDRWAAKEVEAGSGGKTTERIKVKIYKDIDYGGGFDGNENLSTGRDSKIITISCNEDGGSERDFIEYHWTKSGGTKRVNSTTAPEEGAEKLRVTNKRETWVADERDNITEAQRRFYTPPDGYVLRRTVERTMATGETRLATDAPGPNWRLAEKQVERKLHDEGKVWRDVPTDSPAWADEWELVDTRTSTGGCDRPGLGNGCSTDTDYRYAYKQYTWVSRWKKVETITYYIYQKLVTTTWYLWEYEAGPQPMTTAYDPRKRGVSIVGEVEVHHHDCGDHPRSDRHEECTDSSDGGSGGDICRSGNKCDRR